MSLTILKVVGLTAVVLLSTSCTKRTQTEKTTEHAHQEDTHAHAGGDTQEHAGEAPHAEGAKAAGQREEGHVELSQEARVASGIEVQPVGPHDLRVTLDLPGEVVPNADRVAHIVPRFAGIAREVKKGLGEHVREGEVLAVIEGNQSLSTYEVNSLISGTVIEKHVTLGEFVRDDQDIYVVADLSSVWVNVAVYARDVVKIKRRQNVLVESVGAGPSSQGRIDYVGAVVGEATRAATARVVLPNRGMQWRPGMFVTARIVVDERRVPVAVPEDAVQRIEGRDCVFVQDGDGFLARPVVLGKSDGQWTEILSGLTAGEPFVIRGSFVLKSELQKSEASHEH
jgi:cobalt-zinc-cadmium efflux system membrane fusion protein